MRWTGTRKRGRRAAGRRRMETRRQARSARPFFWVGGVWKSSIKQTAPPSLFWRWRRIETIIKRAAPHPSFSGGRRTEAACPSRAL
eukprot:366501-Chlamydomonas_euryale.AAC.39